MDGASTGVYKYDVRYRHWVDEIRNFVWVSNHRQFAAQCQPKNPGNMMR
jgi:hypothetical protein